MNFPNFQMNTQSQCKQKMTEMVNQKTKQFFTKCFSDEAYNVLEPMNN